MADDIGLFEAIHTQRALRYIKPDPIPDALIRKVVEAGTRAASVTFAETQGKPWHA